MSKKNLGYGSYITIEVVKGGFILTHPVEDADGVSSSEAREVFVSPRKLHQKLKEVIDSLSLVADEKE